MVNTRARISNLEQVRRERSNEDFDNERWTMPPPPGPGDAASLVPPQAQQPDGARPSRTQPFGPARTIEERLRALELERESARPRTSRQTEKSRQSGSSRRSRRSHESADTAKSRTPSQHNREESATHTPSDIPVRTPRRTRPDTQTPPEFRYRRTTVTDFKTFMFCKPAEFTGGHDPVKCVRWLREMELCFETCQCDEHMRVIYAARMFRGAALDWWDATREALSSDVFEGLTWTEFKERVKKGFCTELDLDNLENDFRNLTMGNRTVSDYTKSFMEKLRFVGHLVPTEADKVKSFCKGLLPKYRGGCRSKLTLDDAVLEARRLEEDLKAEKVEVKNFVSEKRKRAESSEHWKKSEDNSSGERKKIDTGVQRDVGSSSRFCEFCKSRHSGECNDNTRRCLKCGKAGHQANDCRNDVKCFNCQKFGHISTSCPEPRKEKKDKTKSQGE